jgi:peptide deformylase
MSAPFVIRTFGDPVLKRPCTDFDQIDNSTIKLAADMMTTMHDARGVGLAGNQVGMSKRIFTYDDGKGPGTIVNAKIVETSGEWTYEEGCLSVPGVYFSIVRPKKITLQGLDLDGNELVIEADEYLARIFQHEVDHLNGFLVLDRVDPDARKQALKTLRERQLKDA